MKITPKVSVLAALCATACIVSASNTATTVTNMNTVIRIAQQNAENARRAQQQATERQRVEAARRAALPVQPASAASR